VSSGIYAVLSSLVLSVVPTLVEVSLVTGLFVSWHPYARVCIVQYWKCGPAFAATTVACILTYGTYTLLITRWRTKFRVEMNIADNEAGNRAIDSLINYETVKVRWCISNA
jgi:ABC-type transport system involved in Fe-S cluster assembly fused permease/ATPase subunit